MPFDSLPSQSHSPATDSSSEHHPSRSDSMPRPPKAPAQITAIQSFLTLTKINAVDWFIDLLWFIYWIDWICLAAFPFWKHAFALWKSLSLHVPPHTSHALWSKALCCASGKCSSTQSRQLGIKRAKRMGNLRKQFGMSGYSPWMGPPKRKGSVSQPPSFRGKPFQGG